jgi:translation initiation factor 2-alpha kinase 4
MQRVAEGVSEEEAWRLFYQILDALVHMGSMGIVSQDSLVLLFVLMTSQLHRDIKLTNIFIGMYHTCIHVMLSLSSTQMERGTAKASPFDVLPSVGSDVTISRRLWSGHVKLSCC